MTNQSLFKNISIPFHINKIFALPQPSGCGSINTTLFAYGALAHGVELILSPKG